MNMKSDKKKKIKIVLSTVLAVLCLLLIVGGVWLGIGISREKRYEKQISLGDKYLEELDYENARIAFENAIEISEKKAVGYVKLAVLYIKTGDYESALETVEKGRGFSDKDERFQQLEETLGGIIESGDLNSASEDNKSEEQQIENSAADNEDFQNDQYIIPQETWDMLHDDIGSLINYLDDGQRISEEQAYMLDNLDREDMQYLLNSYVYARIHDYSYDEQQEMAFPILEKPANGYYGLVFAEETINYYMRSLVGKEPDGILTDARTGDSNQWSNITYGDGKYTILTGDGAPVYSARYLEGRRKENRVIATIEVIQLANIGNSSIGIYQVELEIDAESAFGYHVVSVQKFPEVDTSFSQVQASSELQESGQDHSAVMARDKSFYTAWVEGVSGVGVGENITLSATSIQKVHGIRIVPGFGKNWDLYYKNGHPTRLHFEFSDGTQLESDLTEAISAEYHKMGIAGYYQEGQSVAMDWDSGKDWLDFISFGQEIETEWIKITIVSAEAGSKYEDTCITELVVY